MPSDPPFAPEPDPPIESESAHAPQPAAANAPASTAVAAAALRRRSRTATSASQSGGSAGSAPTDPAGIAKARIARLARRTFSRQVLTELGGFNGVFALDAERFPDPLLVACTESAGPRLAIAGRLGLHSTVGADLVRHCINNIAIQGATPLFFLDAITAGTLDPDVVEAIVGGIVEACKADGCALLGGETAQLPGLFATSGYDLAGTIVGVVSRPRLLSGEAIAEGDMLLALPVHGFHATGFAEAQRLLFEVARYAPEHYINELKDKPAALLMSPHRSFLAPIRKLLRADCVHAFAHIVSGGLAGSLPRILPRGLAAQVELSAWEPPPHFAHLQQLGGHSRDRMLAEFNMGIGLVAVIPAARLPQARMVLTRSNERPIVLGRIVKGDRTVHFR